MSALDDDRSPVRACPVCGGEVAADGRHLEAGPAAGDRLRLAVGLEQAIADEPVSDGDAALQTRSLEARDRAGRDRDVVAHLRLESVGERLETAESRDRAAEQRDMGAARRDARSRELDRVDSPGASLEDILLRAQQDRERAALDRARASDDRSRASSDRRDAARERSEALQIRAEAADNLKLAATDGLTGVWTRKFGLEAASRELDRARRTGIRITVGFLDVDALKRVNDEGGHLAGDALLREVGLTVRMNLRPYDVTVRYGGDEFICVLPDMSMAEALVRFGRIAIALAKVDPAYTFTVGVAEAGPTDSLDVLIARADAALLDKRRARQRMGSPS